MRYIFLFGNVHNSTLQDAFFAESNTFDDILQENFIDSYENLTYKTIMGFKWAVTNCRSAQFIMKTDDDMYVNVPEVVKLTRTNTQLLQTTVIGNCSLRANQIVTQNHDGMFLEIATLGSTILGDIVLAQVM